MFKLAFIINGSRKLTDNVSKVIQECENNPNLAVTKFTTSKSKEAIQFGKECAEKQYDAVIAVGGDGTINEVLNGIMYGNTTKPILGIIPCGTGNDFVRSTKLKFNYSDLITSLLERNTTPIDIVRLNTQNKKYYYLNIADIGFGGKVVQTLNKQRNFIGGKLSYVLAILRTFIFYKKPILSIQTADFKYTGSVFMIAICNGSVFGYGMVINPNAKINDDKLNITLLGKISLFDYVKNISKLKRGELIIHPEVKYLEANEIQIKVMKGIALTEMDGEFLESDDLTISLNKSKINLLVY